jgi:ABC-2 type transport system permease protein
MLKKLIAIIRVDILLEFAYPISLVFFLVLPLAFTAAVSAGLSSMMDGGDHTPSSYAATLYVLDQDQGPLVDELFANLQENQLEPVLVSALPEDAYGLEIPAGFSDQLLSGETATITLHILPTNSGSQAVEQYVDAAVSHLGGAALISEMALDQVREVGQFEDLADEEAYFKQVLEDTLLASRSPSVVSDLSWAGAGELNISNATATSAEHASAGQIVTWTQITLLAAAEVFVNERDSGTLRRLLIEPLPRALTLGGKMVSRFVLGLIQMSVLLLGGALIFGVRWGQDPLALIVVSVTFALATVALGMFIGTMVKTRSQANSIVIGLAMGLSALGGAWYPLEITPPIYRQIVKIFPSTWAMQAYTDLLARNAGLREILPAAAVLLGFAAFFILLAVFRFRRLEGVDA